MTETKETKTAVMAISHAELVVRMVEASAEMERPEGATLEELIDTMPDELYNMTSRAAQAAVQYFAECLGECDAVVGKVKVHKHKLDMN